MRRVEQIDAVSGRSLHKLQEAMSPPGTKLARNNIEYAWDLLTTNPLELFWETELLKTDLARASLEWLKLVTSPIYKGEGLPKGEGPIVILPGFFTPSFMYGNSKKVFENLGYDVHIYKPQWGVNVVPVEQQLGHLVDYIDGIEGKVTLIGHSKGGLLAFAFYAVRREEFFDRIGHLITVGAPRPTEVNFGIGTSYLGTQVVFRGDDFKFAGEILSKVDIHFIDGAYVTSIGAENDPVIKGDLIGQESEQAVFKSSHLGLLVNVDVITFIANRMDDVRLINTEAA